jgi:superfamily II DNA or RNA helicase
MKKIMHEVLKNSKSWVDFYQQLSKEGSAINDSRGQLFEYFCKYYFLCEPCVTKEYKNVWLFNEIPTEIKNKLNLGNVDHGVDLVLQGIDGSLSVVQCKFRKNQESIISWTKDNLANLFADGDRADYFIVFTNASGIDSHSLTKKDEKLKIVTLGDLLNISENTFERIAKYLEDENFGSIQKVDKKPKKYQQDAIEKVIDGFQKSDRGQLILPCGAGKTLVSMWIKEALGVKYTLVLVPSLALLRQIKNEWMINSEKFIPYICVCSEKDINKENDNLVVHTYEISGKVSTNSDEVRQFLINNQEAILYATYQSLSVISDALQNTDFEFDLAICDEAHKTSGSKNSLFGLIHDNNILPVKKRLYMTATPRIISDKVKNTLDKGALDYLCDMSNHDVFGPEFYRMSFREAIDLEILVDYKIIAVGVKDSELRQAIETRKFVSDNETIDEIANNFALEKFMKMYGPTHAITFHSSVKKAKDFQNRHSKFYEKTLALHVNGKLSTNERNIKMKQFEKSSLAVMTNSRCLIEGVDVPAIDVIYFCDPKSSKVDIVQATGRALRRADHKHKQLGYVVIPIFHNDEDALDDIIETSVYKNMVRIISALCSHDERLVDEIKKIEFGRGERTMPSQDFYFGETCRFIELVGFDDNLSNSLFYQGIDSVKLPLKTFQDAREYVRALKLKGQKEWVQFCKSGLKPIDIPSNPDQAYKNEGWTSYGDWLGTGRIANFNKIFLDFKLAKDYVHQLKLKNSREWRNYCKSGKKPDNIPSSPEKTYEQLGWISWSDWLGTENISLQKKCFLPYEEAKQFVNALHLENSEQWLSYRKSGLKPDNIPSNPNKTYKNMGWISWSEWLGVSNRVVGDNFLSFQDAREIARSLNFKSRSEWNKFCKTEKRIKNIPSAPDAFYKKSGWSSWGDWLGTDVIATKKMDFLNFYESREYIHSLNLQNFTGWREFCKSGLKPTNIPASPDATYKKTGWISWSDWLGAENISKFLKPNDNQDVDLE